MPYRAAIVALAVALLSTTTPARAATWQADAEGFRQTVLPFFQRYCADCHQGDEPAGDLQLDKLDPDLSQGDDLEVWRIVREQLQFGEMPPADAEQPAPRERTAVLRWIRHELLKTQQPGVVTDQKLILPSYGNYVDHGALFGGGALLDGGALFDGKDAATHRALLHNVVIPTAPRLWRMRPEIYERFTSSISERPQGLSRPFSVLPGRGFQDFAAAYYVDESSADLLLRNAELIVDNQTVHSKFRDIAAIVEPDRPPTDEQVERAIRWEFRAALHREPRAKELTRFRQLYERSVKQSGHVIGGKATLMAVIMQPEAIFRLELGDGPADEHGRRRLAPTELAQALSFALRDQLDGALLRAAEAGELDDRGRVRGHVRRLLAEGLDSNPRMLQFFREYFGYPAATDVFKDPPSRGQHDPALLVSDLEFLIRDILTRDRQVLRELLTTNRAYVNYRVDRKRGTVSRANRRVGYETVYGLPPDWKWTADQPIELSAEQRRGVLTHPAWLVAWSGNFDNHPVQRGKWIRTHLLGGTVPDVPIGVDARVPDDEHRTLRQRLESVSRQPECWRCHKKMDPLGLPFEQYDHYGHYRKLERSRPVDVRGAITRTGIAELDGAVATPVELLQRLARSPHVEEVFVRHAFRFFLGRNETLGDAPTLREACAAYRSSDGSFQALVVSLLSSDSFLFRYQPSPLDTGG